MKELLQNIIYMPCGIHANESIESIVKRKVKEIKKNGYMFFGYSGFLLHPHSQLVPFAKENKRKKEKTYLLISSTTENFQGITETAKDYSINKYEWFDIPKNINILGSKYAIVCKSIKSCDFEIDLNDYIIARGKHKKQRFAEIYSDKLDRICGEYNPKDKKETNKKTVHIDYIAEITEPYAVFVK